ncbi:hypothetical protein KAH94_03970, partial [bacterium]|nr:hypothetical protein [bacterium]
NNKPYQESIIKILKDFLETVQFTIGSFSSGSGQEQEFVKIILLGLATQINSFDTFVADQSGIPCEYFQTTSLFVDKQIKMKKNNSLSSIHLTSLGVTLPSEITQSFNLMPLHMKAEREISLLTKQVVVSIFLMIFALGSLLTHNFLQVGKLQKELHESQEDVVVLLKERFAIPDDISDFDDVVESAQSSVTREENVWAPFSAQSHFLKYLLELHSLDLDDLGFELERVTIKNKEMILKARVKNYPSVAKLEKELRRSKLFKYKGSIQKTDFTMKITLNRNG